MKTLSTILVTLLLTTTALFAKDATINKDKPYYGVSIAQINTGTGHGVGYTLNASINKGRKSLEVGFIYSDREAKIAGADFKYKLFLGNLNRLHSEKKYYKPYLQYNLIYQKGTSYSSELITLGDETYVVNSDPGAIATMGHYLAFGNKIKLFQRAYFDASMGIGYYKGSLNPVDGPGTWGMHKGNSGFTYSFKIGFGYTFN